MIPSIASIIAFLVTFLLGYKFIPYLKKLHFGQTILEIGPKWHKDKQGTPIMGGIMFIIGTLVSVIFAFVLASVVRIDSVEYLRVFTQPNGTISFLAGIVMALFMAAIGFMDDYIKAIKKQNLGLKDSKKTVLQALVAACYLLTLYLTGLRTTYIPFVNHPVSVVSGFGIIFWPIAFVFIYGFTNAVNLTDGVDGLASSVTVVVSLFFMIASSVMFRFESVVVCAALCGALIGFLIWNLHPAKVFMGDTGSMFLGGMAVAMSFYINCPIILILAGILYLLEALSVVIQVAYFKATHGKRLFKMSPIHHHFELCGWKENKIVAVFSLVSLIGCVIAFVIIKLTF